MEVETADILTATGAALDHFAHQNLRRSGTVLPAVVRKLTPAEVVSLQSSPAGPPWLDWDHLDHGHWQANYLVSWRIGDTQPYGIININPVTAAARQAVPGVRAALAAGAGARISGGEDSTNNQPFAGRARELTATALGIPSIDDDGIAVLTWPLAGLDPTWVLREPRAGWQGPQMSTATLRAAEITGVATLEVERANLAGDLNSVTGPTSVGGVAVTGDLEAADITVARMDIAGNAGVGALDAEAADITGNVQVDGVVAATATTVGSADVTGEMVTPSLAGRGTPAELVVTGTLTMSSATVSSIDSADGLVFNRMAAEGFHNVQGDITADDVSLPAPAVCWGCQF